MGKIGIQQVKMISEEDIEYNYWVQRKSDEILDAWKEVLEFPDNIYEGYLDDDYQKAEEKYLMELTIDDVPDNFIRETYLEGI